MKKIRIISLLLIVCLISLHVPVWANEMEPSILSQSCISLDGGKPLGGVDQVLPSAKAAILYSMDSQTLLYSWNADERIDPSGMNKIMTALLAIEMGKLDDQITVTQAALSSVEIGAVSANLKVGEILTLEDLLYCMMVGSANDAAAVIAEYISGSQSRFVLEMNKRAAGIGCKNTNFLNPTGLYQDGQYTTARDLAKITEEAMKSETFRKIFAAVEHTVAATEKSSERKLVTTNYMMNDAAVPGYLDTRITGGKTGALSTADRSLIAVAEHDGIAYLTVVMSAQSKVTANGQSVAKYANFSETSDLLDFGTANFEMRQLLGTGSVLEQFQVADGANDLAVTVPNTVTALMPQNMTRDLLSYRCTAKNNLSAPVETGDVVGAVQLWYDGTCVAQCDLIAMFRINKTGEGNIPLQPQAKLNSNVWKAVLLVVVIVVAVLTVVAGGVLLGMRLVNTRKVRKNRKKRSQRRR